MNIYELAKTAGVSISTASKALNGRHDVNETTRAMIRDLAEKHGYHPSRMARGLANSATENIGLIALRRHGYPFFTNPFYSRVLEGMETEVAARDFNLLLSVVPAEEGKPVPVPKKIREKNVDGLILVGWMPEQFLNDIKKRKIPCVMVDHFVEGMQAFSLMLDNAGGIAMAVKRLKQAGHQRIGFVGGQLSEPSFRERFEGFKKACGELNIEMAPALNAAEAKELESSDFKAWLQQANRPTAVVAANDDHALKLMAQAAELGIQVPGDLAVTGFDDIAYAATSTPPLSTLRVDKPALGARSVRLLIEMIQEGRIKQGIERMPVEWVERASV